MGNCLLGGIGEDNEIVQVITSSNGIMEFVAPITVERITDEFPGHGVFRSHDLFWKPIPHSEVLLAGQSYYLLPLNTSNRGTNTIGAGHIGANIGHVRSNSVPSSSSIAAPYRMSFDSHGVFKRSHTEGHSRKNSFKSGFWKVKLVISPEQLLEILSQEAKTQELIENVRTVAKCGNGVSSSAVGFSDQWSLSSSRNGSKKDVVLEI